MRFPFRNPFLISSRGFSDRICGIAKLLIRSPPCKLAHPPFGKTCRLCVCGFSVRRRGNTSTLPVGDGVLDVPQNVFCESTNGRIIFAPTSQYSSCSCTIIPSLCRNKRGNFDLYPKWVGLSPFWSANGGLAGVV